MFVIRCIYLSTPLCENLMSFHFRAAFLNHGQRNSADIHNDCICCLGKQQTRAVYCVPPALSCSYRFEFTARCCHTEKPRAAPTYECVHVYFIHQWTLWQHCIVAHNNVCAHIRELWVVCEVVHGSSLLPSHIWICWVLYFSSYGIWQICRHLLPTPLPQHHVSFKENQAYCISSSIPNHFVWTFLLADLTTDLLWKSHTKIILCEHGAGQEFMLKSILHKYCWTAAYSGFNYASVSDDCFLLCANFKSVLETIKRLPEQCS